jgi:ribonuclease G
MERQIPERIKKQPMATCVFQEPDLIERTVRDFLTEDVERIVVDNQKAHDRMREMISKISKRSASKIKFYTEAQPVFDRFNISKQLENTFSRQVHLKSGGYIVIDETEALVAIDVNTGRHKGGKDQEALILKVNLEAAEEITRQLRLRNMGGLIVLDFIDMKSGRDRQQVHNRMRDGLRRDKAKTHILPISQLGLMEMTRQRHSESVRAAVYDDCPYCKGRGKVKSTETMSVEIQRKLQEILKKRTRDENDFQLRIVVHPTVLDRLRTEDEKHLIEMEKRYFGKLSFRADTGMHAEQFKIVNVETNEELASVGAQGQLSSAILEYETVLQRRPEDADVRAALKQIEDKASSAVVQPAAIRGAGVGVGNHDAAAQGKARRRRPRRWMTGARRCIRFLSRANSSRRAILTCAGGMWI